MSCLYVIWAKGGSLLLVQPKWKHMSSLSVFFKKLMFCSDRLIVQECTASYLVSAAYFNPTWLLDADVHHVLLEL
jgi:hypothetical protein